MSRQTELEFTPADAPPLYDVTTYDIDRGQYTAAAECGLPTIGVTKWEIRRILRALRQIGYDGHRGDPAIRVYRIN